MKDPKRAHLTNVLLFEGSFSGPQPGDVDHPLRLLHLLGLCHPHAAGQLPGHPVTRDCSAARMKVSDEQLIKGWHVGVKRRWEYQVSMKVSRWKYQEKMKVSDEQLIRGRQVGVNDRLKRRWEEQKLSERAKLVWDFLLHWKLLDQVKFDAILFPSLTLRLLFSSSKSLTLLCSIWNLQPFQHWATKLRKLIQ